MCQQRAMARALAREAARGRVALLDWRDSETSERLDDLHAATLTIGSAPATAEAVAWRVLWPLIMRTQLAHALCLITLLSPLSAADARASETFTATATVKTGGGVTATAPVSVIVDRFSTDSDRDEILAALKKGGTNGVRDLLSTHLPIGTLVVGGQYTAIKYIYARTTPEGRFITAVTGSPIAYVGAGAPGAKMKVGYELGLVMLALTASGPGHGELVPATKVRINDQGAIVTEDYSGEVVLLSNVIGK